MTRLAIAIMGCTLFACDTSEELGDFDTVSAPVGQAWLDRHLPVGVQRGTAWDADNSVACSVTRGTNSGNNVFVTVEMGGGRNTFTLDADVSCREYRTGYVVCSDKKNEQGSMLLFGPPDTTSAALAIGGDGKPRRSCTPGK